MKSVMRGTASRVAAVVAVAGAATTATVVAPVQARADNPPLHHVKYTVGASQPLRAQIYYRDTDPPNFADYSHNPYQYSPRADADLGPGKPWVMETMLANPQDWAMVVASKPENIDELAKPGFVCELRVDDVVVATNTGTRGVLCSLRTW